MASCIVYVEAPPGVVVVVATAQQAAGGAAGQNTARPVIASIAIEQLGIIRSAPRSTIIGRVTDSLIQPKPNVVVRAYQVLTQAAATTPYLVNGELGVQSVVTNQAGEYTFTDLEPGSYRIVPQFTAQEFFPADIVVQSGSLAPELAAVVAPSTRSPLCKETIRSNSIVSADQAARALRDLGTTFAEFYIVRLSPQKDAALRARFTRAIGQLQRTYTLILNLSNALPTLEYECAQPVRCEVQKLTPVLQRYRTLINQLRRRTTGIIRVARSLGISAGDTDTNRLSAVIRREHRSAVKSWRRLPREARICADDTG